MKDRRSDTRYRAVQLQAELVLDDGSQAVEVKDVSRGGICFSHSAPLERGEIRRVSLMLELGNDRFSQPIVLPARIVWSTPLGDDTQIGASFNQLDAVQKRQVEDLLFFLTRDVADDGEGGVRFRTGESPVIVDD